MYSEEISFERILTELAAELSTFEVPAMRPLPCDRWVARSALQKACRRGEVEIAQRAVANLLTEDRYGVWRHLVVICLEDIGVPGMDILERVTVASRCRKWRSHVGGEWALASLLVKKMCESVHCQAVCDLMLRAVNDPALEVLRESALECDIWTLAAELTALELSPSKRALAALAIGGGLAEHQQHRDASAVFDLLAGAGNSSHVVAICRAAYRTCRNEMALLLPLIWEPWTVADGYDVVDDPMPPTDMIGDIPSYAIDTFTRSGGKVSRALLDRDAEIQRLFDQAGVAPNLRSRAVGELLFLFEGGKLKRRAVWAYADLLRQPERLLPTVTLLDDAFSCALIWVASKGREVAEIRREFFLRTRRKVG